MPIIVKGKYINGAPPIVCVPVTEVSFAGIIKEISSLVDKKVSMIEWRADYFEELSDEERVKSLLENLCDITKDTPFLVTIRSKKEGGLCEFSKEKIASLLETVSKAHVADFIDVEYFYLDHARELISRLQQNGALIIASHHDFDETKRADYLEEQLQVMKDADVDMVKLAVYPNSFSDVLTLLEVSKTFSEANPSVPLISISMGDLGFLSRIAGEAFGSVITFGTENAVSAPGQIPRDDLEKMLSLFHKYS